MFIFGVITMTYLERLQADMAYLQTLPDGPGSLFEQDLKAQIDAAKWTMAQKTLTPSQLEDTYFGGSFSTAPERVCHLQRPA